MTEPTPTTPKKRRQRSPGYPSIGLREAIERANAIYQQEGRHGAPVDVILAHWGYAPGSGLGITALSALRKYGLVTYSGQRDQRTARLTDLALDILLREESDPQRQEALEAAALSPAIHSTLWEQYGADLPSDRTLRLNLVREMGFTESAVGDLINAYRDTIELAGLIAKDTPKEAMGPSVSPVGRTLREHDLFPKPRPRQRVAEMRSLYLPISRNRWATLEAPFPLTREEWAQLVATLDAMKPALVSDEDDLGSEGASSQLRRDEELIPPGDEDLSDT